MLVERGQANLAKLRRKAPEAAATLGERISELIEAVGDFPASLRLEEHGRFMIGYSCQQLADRKAAGWYKEEAPSGGCGKR
jgi:hypothetical protein